MDDYEFTWYGDQWKTVIRKAATNVLRDRSAKIVNDAKRGAPVFLGNLRRALSFWIDRIGKSASEITSYIGFTEGNADAFKYAMAVENGRAAGSMPPSDALLLWVKRKFKPGSVALKSDQTLAGNKTGKAYRQIKRGRRIENFYKGLAFVIARSIGRKGIKARPFLLPAFDKNGGANGLRDALEAEMIRLANELPHK